jgi:hypothetical protein
MGASFGCSNAQLGIQRSRHPKRAVKARHATAASHWQQQQQNQNLLADVLRRRKIVLRPAAMRTMCNAIFSTNVSPRTSRKRAIVRFRPEPGRQVRMWVSR